MRKRNRQNYVIWFILLLLMLIGCLDEFPYGKKEQSSISTSLTVKEAMDYFNTHVKEFRVSPQRGGRYADDEMLSLPLWKEGGKVKFKGKEIVEVPVEAPLTIVSRIATDKVVHENRRKVTNTSYNLLAEKQIDGSILFTIARITCDDAYLRKRKRKKGGVKVGYEYMDNFTGVIRYYTLSGDFITGYEYLDGMKISILSISKASSDGNSTSRSRATAPRTTYEYCYEVPVVTEYYTCTDAYVGGELISHSCELSHTDIEYETHCEWYEIDDGDDEDEDDYNDGPTQGGGGGGGVIPDKPAINMMDKNKFVPWYDGANCLDLCKQIMDNYGQYNYGSSNNVFQLLIETNPQNHTLDFWAKNPKLVYAQAIGCIDRHLKEGKLIIVGVDYKEGAPNIDGTDHFIVITGRNYDSEHKLYYNFMDCGTNQTNTGCSDWNRLYYSINAAGEPVFEGYSQAIGNGDLLFSVTHVRPNDGNIINTIPIQNNKE